MLFLHQQFHDFDELAAALRMADLENQQMNRGAFHGEISQLVTDSLILAQHRMNQVILQFGTLHSDYYSFVVPADADQYTFWRNHLFQKNCVGIFPPENEHEGLCRENFNTFSLSIKKEVFDQVLEGFRREEFMKLYKQGALVKVGEKGLQVFVNKLHSLFSLHKTYSPGQHLTRLSEDILQTLPLSLARLLMIPEIEPDPLTLKLRDQAYKKSMEFILANDDEPIKVKDVCVHANISERTLRYIFEEKLHFSPKQFIQSFRLNSFRKYLKEADHDTYKIVDLANHFGYWHMGQLAADYRKMFGELPSETLGKIHKPDLILPPTLVMGS